MLSSRLAKCAVLAIVALYGLACGGDDCEVSGPTGEPLQISCENDVEHQCKNVYAYIKVCEDDARFSCSLASEEVFVSACTANPLDADDDEAIFTWACGDVIAVYCNGGSFCSSYPSYLCRD